MADHQLAMAGRHRLRPTRSPRPSCRSARRSLPLHGAAETDNERERERVKQTANSSEASMCVAAHSSFFLFSWREPTVRDGALDIALSLCCPAEAPPPVLPVSKCYVLEAPEAVLRQ